MYGSEVTFLFLFVYWFLLLVAAVIAVPLVQMITSKFKLHYIHKCTHTHTYKHTFM